MASLIENINSDLFRYYGKTGFKHLIKQYYLIPGFRYMFWHRIANLSKNKGRFLYIIPWLILRRLRFKFGFDIPARTIIGKGFYIGHFGGIVISPQAIIGNNCNISQGITIGFSSRGKNKGYPVIKNSVYIGPGAVIIGNISIGNNVAIGANSVVTKDVPDNAVVAGIPARIINYKGSEGYIINPVI